MAVASLGKGTKKSLPYIGARPTFAESNPEALFMVLGRSP
jgi:hypothetical protein